MNDTGGMLLSVRAEARQLAPPDYAVLDGVIEHAAESKEEALRLVAATLGRLTADLAARGGVPFDEATGRSPLSWSAHSSAVREERYHDKDTGRLVRSGQVTATVSLRVVVRDLVTVEALSGVLAAHPGLEMHGVWWGVDWDNPAWPHVRAAAIQAAIGKARDYAAALGSTVRHIEHVADTGLLGGDTAPHVVGRVPNAGFSSASSKQPAIPALTPVPQELIATIEARFRTTDVSLPAT
jgi:uncharacterized protein YggE